MRSRYSAEMHKLARLLVTMAEQEGRLPNFDEVLAAHPAYGDMVSRFVIEQEVGKSFLRYKGTSGRFWLCFWDTGEIRMLLDTK